MARGNRQQARRNSQQVARNIRHGERQASRTDGERATQYRVNQYKGATLAMTTGSIEGGNRKQNGGADPDWFCGICEHLIVGHKAVTDSTDQAQIPVFCLAITGINVSGNDVQRCGCRHDAAEAA